jgi:hypothetical protein
MLADDIDAAYGFLGDTRDIPLSRKVEILDMDSMTG